MSCKNCEFIRVYEFIFPDGTKTIECLKFNKHLGFTNEKGQVKKIKPVVECKFNCLRVKENIEVVGNINGAVLKRGLNWVVEVLEDNVKSVIFTSKVKNEAENKLDMWSRRKSWIKGISYDYKKKRWNVRIYISTGKVKYVGSYRSFMEAKRALREAKVNL